MPPQVIVSEELASETLQDAWVLYKRLARPDPREKCAVTRAKLNKLFRDGGKIETMIPIYVSQGVIDAGQVHVDDPMKELKKRLREIDFWNASTNLPAWLGPKNRAWLRPNPPVGSTLSRWKRRSRGAWRW